MPFSDWRKFALFAATMLAISFIDERIATGIVVITGIVMILNHYKGGVPSGN